MGDADPLTPPPGASSIDRAMRTAYAEAGAPQAWQQRVFPGGHIESPAMRAAVLAFIADVLLPPR